MQRALPTSVVVITRVAQPNSANIDYHQHSTQQDALTTAATQLTALDGQLRVEEDENIADLSPYDKYKQISSCFRL